MEISDTVFNVQKDPKVKIISDGKEQINIIKKKKKLDYGFGKDSDEDKPKDDSEIAQE